MTQYHIVYWNDKFPIFPEIIETFDTVEAAREFLSAKSDEVINDTTLATSSYYGTERHQVYFRGCPKQQLNIHIRSGFQETEEHYLIVRKLGFYDALNLGDFDPLA